MDESRRTRLPVAPLVAVVVVLLLPILYVLAVGPLNALVDNGYINADSTLCEWLRVIYEPLATCAANCPALESFLTWYTKACGGA